MRAAPLLAALAVASSLGCAGWPLDVASEEERYAFREARRAEEQGDDARGAWERFLRRFPDSALAGEANLELGDLEREAGDVESATQRYRAAVGDRGAAGDRARVRLAMLALERGDAPAARRWIEPARLSRLEGADLRNAYRALAESAESPAERLRWLAFLRTEVPDDGELAALDFEIDRALASLPPEELVAAARRVGDRPPAGRIYLTLAERALAGGEIDRARDFLAEASTRALAPRHAERLAALDARLAPDALAQTPASELPSFAALSGLPLPEVARARGVLGAVLPLTGPYAAFGERTLQGVLLAAGIFDGAGAPQMRVFVRDSAGDPARAAAAVRELAEQGVVAIVGPMISAACEAAAVEAEALGVPLLALTARESIARNRSWVFRVRTRPEEEAQLLVDRALDLGDRDFAILYPDHAAGVGFRSLFWDAVEARGGRIVGVASYDPEATDFGESIRRLAGYTLIDAEERELIRRREAMLERARRLPAAEGRRLRAAARSLARSDGRPIPPIVDFDALFIPDSHENVVLIAPQLAFHEVNGARLLGTDGWYDEDLVRLAGRHVEGALFAASFHPASDVPHVAEFSRRFREVVGEEPEGFAAQGYDAARLVLVQLARGETDRDELRDALLRVEAYAGVSGVLSMASDGNAIRRPFLLGVEDGEVRHFAD